MTPEPPPPPKPPPNRHRTNRPHVGAPLVTPGRPQGGNTTACIRPPSGRHECRPHVYPIHRPARPPFHRRHAKPPPNHTTRRGATCDARTATAGRQRNRPHACVRHPGDMNVAPTFITRLSHATNPRGRHFTAHTPSKPPPTRRGATCDARPTAGRQHNHPHACVRHPGDMNVAPTHMPDNHDHANPQTTPHATTRRGATCDARPTAGTQRNRPHACARHPGDMNVAPTFTPRLSHHTRPAFHRRHPGDMNVAPTCIPRLSHHAWPAFHRRHPGDMNVAPTFTPRLSHPPTRAAGISPPPSGRHECRPYVYPTFITRHQPARPATGVILYMCPYDYEGGPCIPVLPRKKEKNRRERFLF